MPPEKKKIPSKWNNAVIALFLSKESKLIIVEGKKKTKMARKELILNYTNNPDSRDGFWSEIRKKWPYTDLWEK